MLNVPENKNNEYHDLESNTPHSSIVTINTFDDKKVRLTFIRKTLILFTFGIVTTFTNCLFSKFNNDYNLFLQTDTANHIASICVLFVLANIIITLCNSELYRLSPYKYIIYFFFIFSMSFFAGTYTALNRFSGEVILLSTGITTLLTFNLTLFALLTNNDFTNLSDFSFFAILIFLCFIIINNIYANQLLTNILICFGCLIYSFFIILDIQLIVSQKHVRFCYSHDDYVFAAISLYLDVYNLYLFIIDCNTIQ